MVTAAMDKRILVTGGTGFLGSHLIRRLLQDGHQHIRAIRRADSDMMLVEDIANQIEWVEADLLDVFQIEDALEGIELVYHCAGFVSFDGNDKDKLQRINQEGTANLVNECLLQGIEKFIHVSSVAALGRPKELTTISENVEWTTDGFNTQYAISKQQAEMEVWRAMAEGLNAAIVNPSTIIGSGDWNKGPLRFFPLADRGFKWYSTGSTAFVDVADVVTAMVKLMHSDIANKRFIIAGENMSYQQFFDLITKYLERPKASKKLTPLFGQIAWRYEKLKAMFFGNKPFVTKESIMVASLNYEYDNSASVSALGLIYQPIDKTIQKVAHQYKKENKN